MASGAHHYQEAERLLDVATSSHYSAEAQADAFKAAQVHATLANAAAMAAAILEDQPEAAQIEWSATLGLNG